MKAGPLSKTCSIPKNFTILELLIVVAIISILAALLLPALGKARERALEISCTSNFKQIGNTLFIYAGDSQDELPPVCDSGQGQYLEDLIGIYLGRKHADNSEKAIAMYKQNSVWFCPAYPIVENTRGSSYGNCYLFTADQAIHWESYSCFVKGRGYYARFTNGVYPTWHANRTSWLNSNVAVMTTGKPWENPYRSIRGSIEDGATTPILKYMYYSQEAYLPVILKNSAPHARKSNFLYGDGHVALRAYNRKMPYNASRDYTYNWIGF